MDIFVNMQTIWAANCCFSGYIDPPTNSQFKATNEGFQFRITFHSYVNFTSVKKTQLLCFYSYSAVGRVRSICTKYPRSIHLLLCDIKKGDRINSGARFIGKKIEQMYKLPPRPKFKKAFCGDIESVQWHCQRKIHESIGDYHNFSPMQIDSTYRIFLCKSYTFNSKKNLLLFVVVFLSHKKTLISFHFTFIC